MADMQSQLSLSFGDSTVKATGLLVVGAVIGLVLLKRFSGSVSVG